jgi:NAD(P)-dependent dehydrogenase (short-subunit alcohol dehydrogenase family)
MGALIPFPGQSAYGASKAAVKLFTEGLIAELRGSTVRTAVVFPGAVGTNMPLNYGVDIPSPTGCVWPAAENHCSGGRRDPVNGRWSSDRRLELAGGCPEVPAEMRHSEGDSAAFTGVDEALLKQGVARR